MGDPPATGGTLRLIGLQRRYMSDEYAADVRHAWLILVNPTVMLRRTSKIRYTAARPERRSRKPNQLLVEAVRPRKPHTALHVGFGQERNPIIMPREGW